MATARPSLRAINRPALGLLHGKRLPGRSQGSPKTAFISLSIALGLSVSQIARAAGPLDERDGVRRLCLAGPDRALARAIRMQGAARVTEATVLPNPSLVVEHQQTLRGGSERETIVGVSVPIGIGGRRFLLQDAAELRSQQAALEARATLFEAALAFREAYVAAAVAQARLEALSEHQTLLDALSAVVRGLSRAGEAAGYDVLRQETQARLHRGVLESARAEAQGTVALLETWTRVERALDGTPIAELAGGASVHRLIERSASPQHPRARSLDAQSRASAVEARAARRRWVPELELFAGYRRTALGSETGDGLALALSIPLTFFDHGQGAAALAEAEQELSRNAAASLRRQHLAQLKSARARLRVLEAAVADAERATVAAAAVRDQARQLYAAGEASITELLDAFRAAEEARLAQITLWNEVALARLAVMRSAGTFFDPELDRVCAATGSSR